MTRAEINIRQLAQMLIARDILRRRTLKADLAGGVSFGALVAADLANRRARR
jgi:hypothetical protein